jgi:positive regulator of sigma E activity
VSIESQVTWIRVEKPVFDLAGILISSLGITGICVLVAVLLGGAWGAWLVRRNARRPEQHDPALTLRVIRS